MWWSYVSHINNALWELISHGSSVSHISNILTTTSFAHPSPPNTINGCSVLACMTTADDGQVVAHSSSRSCRHESNYFATVCLAACYFATACLAES